MNVLSKIRDIAQPCLKRTLELKYFDVRLSSI